LTNSCVRNSLLCYAARSTRCFQRLATRLDVVFEDVLAEVPDLQVVSDTALLAGGWFRGIVLRKK